MLVFLEGVLAPEDVARVRDGLSQVVWDDGRKTAGPAAQAVKSNQQAAPSDSERALAQFVAAALARHAIFQACARPSRPLKLLFSRYGPGMAYGLHNDDAIMGEGHARMRTDFALTLFLADPESYAGGALVLHGPAGEQAIKLAPGDAVLYSAGALHRVEAVGAGERLAAVVWGQSLVRDPGARAVLFELAQARWALPNDAQEAALRIDQVMANLIRRWADP